MNTARTSFVATALPTRSSLCRPLNVFGYRPNVPTPRRGFHATPPKNIIAECVDQTQALIIGLHTITDLPWAATLPLTAFLIRLGILGPLSFYAHTKANKRRELIPLIYAWQHAIRKTVMKEHGAEGPAACHKLAATRLRKKGMELRKVMGVQYWKSYINYIQLPVFLLVIESIRKMCGTHGGLLGLLIRRPGEDASTEEVLADTDAGISHAVKESLANEGALWFPDLMVPDPVLILPFMLSGCLFANIMYHDRRAAPAGVEPGKWQVRWQRSIKVIALTIGPATLGVPSAMLVYWISSSLCALGQNVILDWYLPGKPVVQPCKPKRATSAKHVPLKS